MTREQEALAAQLNLTPEQKNAITLWWIRQTLARRKREQYAKAGQ